MHPDVVGEESDRCPKCGMKLVAVAAPVTYVCPMHPEVVSEQPDRCPKCGMKLVDASLVTASSHEHEGHAHEHRVAHAAHEEAPAGEHDHEAGGIEWEDDMLELNRRTTPANMRWMLVDRDTGAANHGIAWQFTVGDRVKLRLVNEMDSDHPMHHPFHVHGAGRFVVLARDGVAGDRTTSGRTPSSSAPARPSTSCSTSRTPVAGWPTATSPSTTRAG